MTIPVNGYCDRYDLQSKLGDFGTDQEKEEYLDSCILDASRIIDEYTGSYFYSKSINETIDRYSVSDVGIEINDYGDKMHFPAPIVSITSITEGGTALVENTDFYVYKGERFIERETWSSERKDIVVSGSIGYATTPNDIHRICLEIAGVLSGLETRGVMGADGDMMDIIKNSIPKWEWKMLNKRRRIFV